MLNLYCFILGTIFGSFLNVVIYRVPKKKSIVPGGLFKISKSDEKKLDVYEDFPILYKKHYFYYYGKKVMTYTMVKKTLFKFPTERYLNIVKQGYKDCDLDKKNLLKALKHLVQESL